jgi:leucyl aminopeptidase (aminopeptidase T)
VSLERAATNLLVKCLDLKSEESCLVVCDSSRRRLGQTVYEAAIQITASSRLCVIQPPDETGWQEDTLNRLEKEMFFQDVILFLTGRSLSHTDARRRALRRGARLASMPGITRDVLLRAASADPREVHKRSKRLKDTLSDATSISVSTEVGTNVTFSVEGMEGHMEDGLYTKPGRWGNLPGGEASIGPREGTAAGIIVVDWSMSGVGRLREPLSIRVEDGRAIEINGKEAGKLLAKLNAFGGMAFNLAEFGLGTNASAQLSGVVLEDEKVLGTAHFALGNNISFGGTSDVPIHLDGVLRFPNVRVDGRPIMVNGHLV